MIAGVAVVNIVVLMVCRGANVSSCNNCCNGPTYSSSCDDSRVIVVLVVILIAGGVFIFKYK